MTRMAWWRRGATRKRVTGTAGATWRARVAHLEQFVASRRGVEAFIEPRTHVTETTVSSSPTTASGPAAGADPQAARRVRRSALAIPVYDVQLVGYPQRMRDYNERRRRRR